MAPPVSAVFALHTHGGDNDPNGRLWQDGARTISAVNDGDPVGSWYDPDSGVDAFSVASAERPLLRYSSTGVPWLEFNGGKVLYINTRAWFAGKRGAFYIGHRPGNTHTASNLLSTITPAGPTAPTFQIFSSPGVGLYTGGEVYSYKYFSSTFLAMQHQDWEWEEQAFCRFSDTQMSCYVNCEEVTTGTITDNQPANNYFAIGSKGANGFVGGLSSVLYSADGDHQHAASSLVKSRMPAIHPYTRQITCDGDSLTAGGSITAIGGAWPNKLATLLGDPDTAVRNVGIGGLMAASLELIAPTRVDDSWLGSVTDKVVIISAGSNDLYFGVSAAATMTSLENYCLDRQAAGARVIIATVLPRSNAGTPLAFETNRQTLNGLITANYASFADGLADIAAEPIMGPAGAETNTTYYLPDLAHPNATGNDILAGIYEDAVNAL